MEFHGLKSEHHFNCTVKNVDEKGKETVCNGSLKEWMTAPPEVQKQVGNDEALYRCRRCGAVYKGRVKRHLSSGKKLFSLPPQFPFLR